MFSTSTKILVAPITLGVALAVPFSTSTGAQSSSPFFASASLENTQTIVTQSYGDLWPSCWSDDNNLYAANGDGRGFDLTGRKSDIDLSRISGSVDDLTGKRLASGDQLGTVWGPDTKDYNRKPTGMLCVNGALYLAIQDLDTRKDAQGHAHLDAPSASISKSADHGLTWTWDKQAPMFDDYKFTTIFFLDFGKDNANAIDPYIYVYGLDDNWARSDGTVPNPVDLYLARVTPANIQNRLAWQFYAGLDATGNPQWVSSLDARMAVLHVDPTNGHSVDVISQGGVVYDKPLNRYIFTTWAASTWSFYEAPEPWGPWTLFVTKTFTDTATNYGGYATTIPSKFISADGLTMWVQSDNCVPCGASVGNYAFSLRKLVVMPSPSAMQASQTAATIVTQP